MPKMNAHIRQEITLDPRIIEETVDELRKEEVRRTPFSTIVKEAISRIGMIFFVNLVCDLL